MLTVGSPASWASPTVDAMVPVRHRHTRGPIRHAPSGILGERYIPGVDEPGYRRRRDALEAAGTHELA